MSDRYRTTSLFNKFIINTLLIVIFWYVFFFIFRRTPLIHPYYEQLTHNLTNFLLRSSQYTLHVIGEESLVYKKSIQQIGGNGIYLDRGCLGRNLMGLFACFLIAFPGRWDTKAWYIPLGIVLIFILNILRLVGLYLTNKYYPQYMYINHHLLFKVAVYALTFLLWYIWVTYLRKYPLHK